MNTITLEGQDRELGKTATGAIRRAEQVPCVLYGPNQEPVHFKVEASNLRPVIFTSQVNRIQIQLDGASYDCLVKKIDYHPVTDEPLHADFLALTDTNAVTVTVPVKVKGTPAGAKVGGLMKQSVFQVKVKALAQDLVGQIEVDVTPLEVGQALYVRDLDLPNVEVLDSGNRAIVVVEAPKRAAVTTEAAPAKKGKK